MRKENKMQDVFVESISKLLSRQKYYHLLASILFISFEVKTIRDVRESHNNMGFWEALTYTYPTMIFILILFVCLIPFVLFRGKIETRLIRAIECRSETHITFTMLNNTSFEFDTSKVTVKKKSEDWYLGLLFSSKFNLFKDVPTYNKRTGIVKIDAKKFYITPGLFELTEFPLELVSA